MRHVAFFRFRLYVPAPGIVQLSEEQTRIVGVLFISTTQDTEGRNISCFEIGGFFNLSLETHMDRSSVIKEGHSASVGLLSACKFNHSFCP
jgi:hypothetical protein